MTSEELLARLKAVECPDATYPAQNPALVFDRAQGSEIFDVAGKRYLDLCAGFGVLALGHNHPSFLDALSHRGLRIAHGMGDVYASRAKVELIETLLSLLPRSFSRVALALSGAQAVELAVKTAMLATRKTGFITVDESYHGLDLGILPLTAREDFRAPFAAWLPQSAVVSVPPDASPEELDAARDKLDAAGHGLAAFLLEPIQGRAGVRPLGRAFLAQARGFCDEAKAMLIYDEVFTGLGRTGRMTFAEEIPCDLLCLGKALGGGLPLSACVGTERAMRAWPESKGEALHTGTFFGHPLACEVSLATLAVIRDEKLAQRAKVVGAALKKKLQAALSRQPRLTEIRGEGLMIAVEFREKGLGAKLMDQLRAEGFIALASGGQGESLTLTPALTISDAAIEEAVQGLISAVSAP